MVTGAVRVTQVEHRDLPVEANRGAMLPGQLNYLNYTHAVVLGLVLGFAAIVGDLAESVIKRSCDVKDSGSFLPGIGGALDLIDSILFTAPLLFFYLRFVIGVS